MALSSTIAFLFLSLASSISAQLEPKKYLPLPLGSVLPSGWLASQLQLQVSGLAGHEHEFYSYVAQGTWTGGSAFYSELEEAGSYWFNGIVSTSVLSSLIDSPKPAYPPNPDLSTAAQNFLDFVLGHQDENGWLGPEVLDASKPRYLWGRYPFLMGLTQMIEAKPEQADVILNAMYKFIGLANQMIQNNEGLEEWGQARWFEFVITLQWLYDNHPNGQEALLLDTMQRLRSTGVDWAQVFSEEYFPKTATEGLSNPIGNPLIWHGVNVAEGLKAGAVAFRFSSNESDLDSASEGWDRLFQYHGRPSGVFAADEYLAGLEAVRGSELCLVVELMFSGSYLYQVIGDLKFADRVEKVAYNALPGTLTGNMWSRQYLQQQNQIASKNMDPNPFPRDGPYSNVFGLEPNYPCCTVNHPQGWPKFISNAFLTTADKKSLIHVYLGPLTAKATLGNDNAVTVKVETNYPFSDTLATTVTASNGFTYYVRIPSWVANGTLATNGGDPQPLSPVDGLQAIQLEAGTTSFVLTLPAEITTESRPHGSIAVHRGPFTYAFDISRTETVLSTNANESHAVDLQFDPAVDWQYAIDPSTLAFNSSEGDLPSPIFDAGLPPLTMTALACKVNWSVAGDLFASSPPESPSCTGEKMNITLWPYGATKMRIGEFPVFSNTQA